MKIWKNLRDFENLHITLWLVKDFCWVALFKPLGLLMILPTVVVAIYLTVKTWKDLKERLHNLAVCFWILANSTWMIGEFYFHDTWRPAAICLFCLGIICIGYWHLVKKNGVIDNIENKKGTV